VRRLVSAARWLGGAAGGFAFSAMMAPGCTQGGDSASSLDPAAGGAEAGAAGAGAGAAGAGAGAAGAAPTPEPPDYELLDPVPVLPATPPPAVLASDLGDSYRFVAVGLGGDTLLVAAEGDGPPVVLRVIGCDAVESLTLPDEYAGFRVELVGHAAGGEALLGCDAEECALFYHWYPDNDALAELPQSRLPADDWEFMVDRTTYEVVDGYSVLTLRICLVNANEQRCYGSEGWGEVEPGPFYVEHEFEPPRCDKLSLVMYFDGFGATAEGALVRVNLVAEDVERCTVLSDPLGPPLSFVEFLCGVATNRWLVTESQVYREVDGPGDGCDCFID